jgi:hypothetical protein
MYYKQSRITSIAIETASEASRATEITCADESAKSNQLHSIPAAGTQSLETLAPQSVIGEVVSGIRNAHLRTFLDATLNEPLIHGLITLPLVRTGQPVQFPIQVIRRIANTYALDYARTVQEKDLLTVAAVLWGVRSLLPLSIYGDTDLQDVFCTLIRTPLHQLDDRTCQVAIILRSLIGLGDEGSADESLSHLQSVLKKRIKGLHVCKAWLLPSIKAGIERQTVRGVLKFSRRAAAQ